MSENCRTQKQYDHRLRLLIQNTRDLDLAVRHGVPRSTARRWLKQSRTDVVSIDVLDMDADALQREVLFLRRRVTRLLTMLHLVVVAFKVAEFSFDRVRIPDGTSKQRLLRAIERTRTHLPLRGVLRLIGMSSTRYHAWLAKHECGLDDQPCCPRTTPQQLTRASHCSIRRQHPWQATATRRWWHRELQPCRGSPCQTLFVTTLAPGFRKSLSSHALRSWGPPRCL
jgi:putative transposase